MGRTSGPLGMEDEMPKLLRSLVGIEESLNRSPAVKEKPVQACSMWGSAGWHEVLAILLGCGMLLRARRHTE